MRHENMEILSQVMELQRSICILLEHHGNETLTTTARTLQRQLALHFHDLEKEEIQWIPTKHFAGRERLPYLS